MPRLFQKRGGTWSEILSVFQKQGGTWVEILNIFQKIGGTWTKVFAAAKIPDSILKDLIEIRICGTYGDPCIYQDLISYNF